MKELQGLQQNKRRPIDTSAVVLKKTTEFLILGDSQVKGLHPRNKETQIEPRSGATTTDLAIVLEATENAAHLTVILVMGTNDMKNECDSEDIVSNYIPIHAHW